jgi:hypothetical protein
VNSKAIDLSSEQVLTPAFIGIAAFWFLRLVNDRGSRAGVLLVKLSGAKMLGRTKWGALGGLVSILPLIFGFFLSWSIAKPGSPAVTWLQVWTGIGILILVVATYFHVSGRANDANPQGKPSGEERAGGESA